MTIRWRQGDGVRAVVMAALFFVAASSTLVSTRFTGTVAFLWIAAPVLLAALLTARRRQWPALVAGGWAGSFAATWAFGLGLVAAPFAATLNVVEVLVAASLLRRLNGTRGTFDALGRLAVFVLSAGVLAPLVGAIGGGLIAHLVTGTGLGPNAAAWFAGHALGMLTFTPIFVLVGGGEMRRWLADTGARRKGEGAVLMLLAVGVAGWTFWQQTMPLLFAPFLPLVLLTFRLGAMGAAAAMMVVAVIGGVLTLAGHGPIHLLAAAPAAQAQFFQFYLATIVLTALPVAADLERRNHLFTQLRDSEARYRLLTENSTDIVMNLDRDGIVRYASPSIGQWTGFDVDEVVGRYASALIAPADRDAMRALHEAAIEAPERTFIAEFQGRTKAGDIRWFETHMRAVLDDGAIAGIVNVTRDVSHRKSIEARLTEAASTDVLTGLPNRRSFDTLLADWLARAADGGPAGCVAIFDLDHFKRVNDGHGHASGDIVLRAFAQLAREHVREGDLVARLGGEEFGVLLNGANRDQARMTCERLRMALAAMRVLLDDGVAINVTASAGVAAFDGSRSAADVLRAADEALYEAKAMGRDRLRLAA